MHFVGLVLLIVAASEASSEATIYWVGVPEPTTESLSKSTTTSRPTTIKTHPEPYKFVPRQNVAFSGNEGRGVAYWFPTSSSLRSSGSMFTTSPTSTSTTSTTTTTTELPEITTKKQILSTNDIYNILSTTPTAITTSLFHSEVERRPLEHKYYPLWRLNVVNGPNNTTDVSLNVTAADARFHNQVNSSRDTNFEDAFVKLVEHDPKGAVDTLWNMMKTFYSCVREQWSSGKVMSCIAKRTMNVINSYLYFGNRLQNEDGFFDEPRKMSNLQRTESDEDEDEEEDEEDKQEEDTSNDVADYNEDVDDDGDGDDTSFQFTNTYVQKGSRRRGNRKKRKDRRRERLKYFAITKHILPILYSIGLTLVTLKVFSLFLLAATSGKALIVSVVALTIAIANIMKKVSIDATRRTDTTPPTGTAVSNYDNNFYPSPIYNTRRLGFLNDTTSESYEKKNKYYM